MQDNYFCPSCICFSYMEKAYRTLNKVYQTISHSYKRTKKASVLRFTCFFIQAPFGFPVVFKATLRLISSRNKK